MGGEFSELATNPTYFGTTLALFQPVSREVRFVRRSISPLKLANCRFLPQAERS